MPTEISQSQKDRYYMLKKKYFHLYAVLSQNHRDRQWTGGFQGLQEVGNR